MSQQTKRRRDETTFIEPSGGILTEQLLHKLREEECNEAAVAPQTFALNGEAPSTTTELEDKVADAWEDLKERWDSISQDNTIYDMDTSEVRDRWLIPLLEHLDFEPVYQSKNLHVNGLEANLSHYGWAPEGQLGGEDSLGLPPVTHLIQPDKDEPLDSGNHVGTRASGKSPHDELQRFLNAADQQWSLVADGLKLRLLRDYYHTYTRGYVEFDLENIFTNRNFEDFRALYRLCHASRFVVDDDTDEDDADAESPLESLYQIALATGVKIGEDLQSNVVEALETLGNGFLALNPEIRSVLEEGGQDEADQYYQDLLRVVYRLLFLMFAEQRGMMADRGDLYTDEYSINTLRDRSERAKSRDTETDLWEGLQVTFRLVGGGYEDEEKGVLSVPGYNGGLFDDSKLEYVTESTCPNHALLDAIHNLTHVEQEGYQQRISYADLGVDEIGAVYESLLEFTPQYADTVVELEDKKVSSGSFYLDDRGMDRKETGSYYTKPELVDELIDSALKPVVDDRVGDGDTPEEKEEALLSIDVCDPACGSGAFLTAANDFLGKRLAQIRSGSEYPEQKDVRKARRSVAQHCLYGVDLNPMAVELAKVSIWINSAVKDQPLSFLDHRIKQGNSLIGVTESTLEEGIPYEAYEKSGGRDGHPGTEVRREVKKVNNRVSLGGDVQTDLSWEWDDSFDVVSLSEELEQFSENTISQVKSKSDLLEKLKSSDRYIFEAAIRDVWVAAFFWDLEENPEIFPTSETIQRLRGNPSYVLDDSIDAPEDIQKIVKIAADLSSQENFFHWDVEFPLVWDGPNPGFDCVLGNPPWEEVRSDESEYFAVSAPEIAAARKKDREELIKELEDRDPDLYSEWKSEEKRIKRCRRFYNNSPSISPGSVGKVNTYPLFTYLNSVITNHIGRAGFIVKTAIATDHHYSSLFRDLFLDGKVLSLYDFENNGRYFPGVHGQERFCLLTLSGGNAAAGKELELLFRLDAPEEIHTKPLIDMSKEVLETLSAGSYQLPAVNSNKDLQLLRNIAALPNTRAIEQSDSGWDLKWGFPFDGGNVQDIATIREELPGNGPYGIFEKATDGTTLSAVYEGKFVSTFTHRNRTFENIPQHKRFGRALGDITLEEDLRNEGYEIEPRYWVPQETVDEYYGTNIGWDHEWTYLYGRKTKDTNQRSFLGAITPKVGSTDTAPHLLPRGGQTSADSARRTLAIAGITNSFIFDYQARNYISGTTLGKNLVLRLAVPKYDVLTDYGELYDRLVDLSFKLSYSSRALDSLAEAIGRKPQPSYVEESERREARCELDAIVAKVYGVERDTLSDVIDSFERIKKYEQKELNEFVSKDLTLKYFEKYS